MEGFPNNDFNYPVVQTWALIRIRFDQKFRENPDQEFIDAGESIAYYQFDSRRIPTYDVREYIPDPDIEETSLTQLLRKIKFQLTKLANAYKWKSEKSLWLILERAGNILRNDKVRGYTITDAELEGFISEAMENRDTMILQPNASIRILENPLFNGYDQESTIKTVDYAGRSVTVSKDGVIKKQEKKRRKSEFTNKGLGQEIRVNTNQEILTALSDYDLKEGLITKAKIASAAGISEKTVERYLKKYPELAEIFNTLKPHTKKPTRARKGKSRKESKAIEHAEYQYCEKTDNRSYKYIEEEKSEKMFNGWESLKPRKRPKMIDVIRNHRKKQRAKP